MLIGILSHDWRSVINNGTNKIISGLQHQVFTDALLTWHHYSLPPVLLTLGWWWAARRRLGRTQGAAGAGTSGAWRRLTQSVQRTWMTSSAAPSPWSPGPAGACRPLSPCSPAAGEAMVRGSAAGRRDVH